MGKGSISLFVMFFRSFEKPGIMSDDFIAPNLD